MRKTDYTNEAQQRALRALTILAGHEANGLSPKEIGQAINTVPGTITRDLFNLQAVGMVEQIPETGRYRLGPRIAQIGIAVQISIERAKAKAAELEQRFTRSF